MEQKKSQANNARCNEKKFSSKYIINIQTDTGGSERNHKNIIIIITHFFLVEAYFLLLFVAWYLYPDSKLFSFSFIPPREVG